jgi:hypothetical protein
MSLKEGNVNIYRNYDLWPIVRDDNQKKLTINDIPSDDKIIKAVSDFA